MSGFFVLLIIAWNVAVSWMNARSVGLMWEQTKIEGGWARIVSICALVQAVVGFSMLIVAAEMAVVSTMGYPVVGRLLGDVWYLAIIVPALGTGIFITIDSVREALRRRDAASGLTAAYNAAAMAGNIWQAIGAVGSALSDVTKTEDDEDASGVALLAALVLGLLAIAGGALLTWVVVEHYRSRTPVLVRAWR